MTIKLDFSAIGDAINTVLGKPEALINKPAMDPAFEQELMAGIDPATQKRHAIGAALIAASKTLGSTPGGFLQGMGQAAPAGAEAYTSTRDANQLQRQKTLGYISDTKRKADDDTLNKLKRYIDMGGAINDEERAQQKQETEQARIQRDIQEWNVDMAIKEGTLQNDFDKRVNDRQATLDKLVESGSMTAEEAAQRIQQYRTGLQKELTGLVKKYGVDKGHAAGGNGLLPGDAQKGITNRFEEGGVNYFKKNGRWIIGQ